MTPPWLSMAVKNCSSVSLIFGDDRRKLKWALARLKLTMVRSRLRWSSEVVLQWWKGTGKWGTPRLPVTAGSCRLVRGLRFQHTCPPLTTRSCLRNKATHGITREIPKSDLER